MSVQRKGVDVGTEEGCRCRYRGRGVAGLTGIEGMYSIFFFEIQRRGVVVLFSGTEEGCSCLQ